MTGPCNNCFTGTNLTLHCNQNCMSFKRLKAGNLYLQLYNLVLLVIHLLFAQGKSWPSSVTSIWLDSLWVTPSFFPLPIAPLSVCKFSGRAQHRPAQEKYCPYNCTFPSWDLLLGKPWWICCQAPGSCCNNCPGACSVCCFRFHVRRGGGGRGCPPYAVTQPGATSSVNILLSGAHPAVFLRHSIPRPGWCSKSLVVIFFPLNLSSSEFSLDTLALSCGLVHKMTSFPLKRENKCLQYLAYALIIGRLFLRKEDLALWKSPLRANNCINSLYHIQ